MRNGKKSLALFLAAALALTPVNGVYASDPGEPVTEQSSEKVTEKPDEKSAEESKEKTSEKSQETNAPAAGEQSTEVATEKVRETSSETMTGENGVEVEKDSEASEENVTETVAEQTESLTEINQEDSDTSDTDESNQQETDETEENREEEKISENASEISAENAEETEISETVDKAAEKNETLAAEGQEKDDSDHPESNSEPEIFTTPVDNTTSLEDGVYTPDWFTYSKADGKTSKTTISCSKVTVTNGKSYATIVIGSSAYSYVKASGNKYQCTQNETENISTVTIPIRLGINNTMIGNATKMSTEVAYLICAAVSDKKEETGVQEEEPAGEKELFTVVVDNSTSLADGIYTPDSFTFTKANGGASKTAISCTRVVVKNGKSYAEIVIGSSQYSYIKASGKKYTCEIHEEAGTSSNTVPIHLGADNIIIGYSKKMKTEIAYSVCAVVTAVESSHEKDESPEPTQTVDNRTALKDGLYVPLSFSFAKKDGQPSKTSISCQKIIVKGQRAYAAIQFSSKNYTYVRVNGYKYMKEETEENSSFVIPVKLNADNEIIGNTVAMSKAQEIVYIIHPVLSEQEETEKPEDPEPSETESETEKETETETEIEPDTETENEIPADPAKLQNGDYRTVVLSSASMFKVVDCILNYKDGVMRAKITLSGTGYDKLFMGNGAAAAKAGASQMIVYSVNGEGKYVFEIPVSALDMPIDVAAHSVKNDTWYDRQLTFQTAGMQLISVSGSDETETETEKATETETEAEKKNDKDPEKESVHEKDLSGSTGAVDSSTSLPDGVYAPDKFSWSGGSGRVSISCNKITVSGGRAYATIVFSSDSYAYVKANGNKYTGTVSGGTTSFVIPVKLNANNTIIGMTTKMSAAHEITYSLYIYMKAADNASGNAEKGNGTDDEAPEIAGLQYQSETKLEHAEYFKIFNYSDGIRLLEVDMTTDTARKLSDSEDIREKTEEQVQTSEEITAGLYQADVVKYLIVPENAEIPVGLEKEMIIVQLPVESVCAASVDAMEIMERLGVQDKVSSIGLKEEKDPAAWYQDAMERGEIVDAGSWKDLNFAALIKSRCDLALFPAEFIQEEGNMSENDPEYFEKTTSGFGTLGIPLVIDRSSDEKTELAKAEWIKVYGALLGCEKQAEALYAETVEKTE